MSEMSYAEAPISVSEARANRSQSAADWTPRDALVELLRQIDRKEIEVEQLVMAYRYTEPNNDGRKTTFSAAAPDLLQAVGLMQRGAYLLQRRAE